ncbi:MAG: aminotransferase class I/II-fold pyridoxal phosphate-dependent enzyme [Hyphomicrobiales bacterium]|nr:aminotransferase class I/II-fold pyridoxal phosphate-dependent enzyme [Hyphomicrobiales bacterium]
MPHDRLLQLLNNRLDELAAATTLKGREDIVCAVLPPHEGRGLRFLLEDNGNRPFIRMNSNSYLGLSFQQEVETAEEDATRRYGTGPGAVRFISGTWSPHKELEAKLAAFHDREAAMIFSSAYATVMGVLPQLITDQTCVISDALNHNCIINAIRLARPAMKRIYKHLDLSELRNCLDASRGSCRRAIVVTDGIFSMRGDYASLRGIMALAREYDSDFEENVLVVVDDSHGVGAFGPGGRGTEAHEGSEQADLLIGTLGKAFGVNGGYVATSATVVEYLRETSPSYIYSNPITPSEAAAGVKAVGIVDSPAGAELLSRLRAMTRRFEEGIAGLGFETIPGEHPIVPLVVRDTQRTLALVGHLRENNILATGLNYTVVPKGDEEIRFQISVDHTEADLDVVLNVLKQFAG